MEKTSKELSIKNRLKENLIHAEETRQKTIAELSAEAATVEGEISKNRELQQKASRAGDIDSTIRYLSQIQELETRKLAIMDVVRNLDMERFYTDADVISAANACASVWNASLTSLTAKWEKAVSALCDLTEELCRAKQSAGHEFAETLAYHSASRNGQLSDAMRENVLSKQGLSSIVGIPNMAPLHDLLYVKIGAKANALVTISNGGYVPDF